MPELPDVVVYLERLEALVGGEVLRGLRIASPWVLRTFDPPPEAFAGVRVSGLRRMGKRIVLECDGDLFVVIHLMVAGRLRRRDPGTAVPPKRGLAAFDFDEHTFLLTEEGTKKRASIHLHRGAEGLSAHERGGVEPLEAGPAAFAAALTRERHTLKRALTDPRIVSGVGGAYADEIMHRARLGPLTRTDRLSADDLARLHAATRQVLGEWVDRLRTEAGDGFPEKVTAFHPEMAVHGRYGEPCPVCGAPVQRIRYASNETNYCPGCQTGGRILADRALSRLLKDDWPQSLDDLDA
ncbi:MAG: formamidopyrimidine-DNA glycosylase [Actinobacteria bacterium]|nr:formamidopyrimidine-DNA glycosylase [Actinomycetota bacterium]